MNYLELSKGIVHAGGAIDDHTLCGVTVENLLGSADEFTEEMYANESELAPYMAPTSAKITCDQCSMIIRHCCKLGTKAIKPEEERRREVKIVNGKIAEATCDEMFDYYLTRDWDTVMPFAEFLRQCEANGTKITDGKEGGAK